MTPNSRWTAKTRCMTVTSTRSRKKKKRQDSHVYVLRISSGNESPARQCPSTPLVPQPPCSPSASLDCISGPSAQQHGIASGVDRIWHVRGAIGRPRKDRVQSATAPPQEGTDSLKVQLGAAPVAALGVVANLAVCLQPEPVGHGPVLLRLAGELHLDLQGLVGRL